MSDYELTPEEIRAIELEGKIKCPDCGRWQDDEGQTKCDYYGCTGLFDRED